MIVTNNIRNLRYFAYIIAAICMLFAWKTLNEAALNRLSRGVGPSACGLSERIQSEKFNVVIGHAYGAPIPATALDSEPTKLSVNIENYLVENAAKIENVIFSGDVFSAPNLTKWNNLKDFSEQLNVPFWIAPGNHDLGYSSPRFKILFADVFPNDYPIKINSSSGPIVLVDTQTNNWGLGNSDWQEIAKQYDNKTKITIIGHHIFARGMVGFANQRGAGSQNLPSFEHYYSALTEKFEDVVFLSGDTGAFTYQPRMSCMRRQNVAMLANGLGGQDDDILIAFDRNNMWSVPLAEYK